MFKKNCNMGLLIGRGRYENNWKGIKSNLNTNQIPTINIC